MKASRRLKFRATRVGDWIPDFVEDDEPTDPGFVEDDGLVEVLRSPRIQAFECFFFA